MSALLAAAEAEQSLMRQLLEEQRKTNELLTKLFDMQEEKQYTVKEAALVLRMSESKVRKYIDSGELKAINIGEKTAKNARYRLKQEFLDKFQEGREVAN